MAVTPLQAPVPKAKVGDEGRFSRRGRLVLVFALVLISVVLFSKAYRLTLPTEGWSSTIDFETEAPIFEDNLLGFPSELRAGDRLIAVEGVPFLRLQQRALRGQKTELNYRAGQTVRYRVLRDGTELEVNVPLYAGTSIALGSVIWQFFNSNQIGNYSSLLAVLIVTFVLWKRPNNLTAHLLFLQLITIIASTISWTVTPVSIADTLNPVTFYLASYFSHWIHFFFEPALALHVILSFPKPSTFVRKRWVLTLLYAVPFFTLLFVLSTSTIFLGFILVTSYNLLSIFLVFRMFFAKRDEVGAAQVRWFGFGYAIANLGTLLFGLWATGILPGEFAFFTEGLPFNLVYFACTAIAILRYRLFDIDVILNRTLVWGGLTAGVVGLYALVVGGLGWLLAVEDEVALSLLATGLVAVTFSPLRERLQRGVNRLLYGQRDEPYEVLSELSQQLGTVALPASVLPTVVQTIAYALKLPYVAVLLEQAGEAQVFAETGKPTRESVTLPLVYQSERVGELRVGPRANEARFSPSELELLRAIAQQASVAAYAVRLTSELQNSRERLVAAREEERRRLRRDLHDGLGPTLASIAMKLEAARNLTRKDPAAADELLGTLKAQAQAAIGDIRQLAYALRPPALDELGLLGALQEGVCKHEGDGVDITLSAPDALPPLPAAVEVAAYRIVQEALANVLHHAQAHRCEVTVRLGEGLELGVSDDGVGLTPGYRAGVGLHSMRERAEELGGRFAVTARPQGGTQVTASLPLPHPEEQKWEEQKREERRQAERGQDG